MKKRGFIGYIVIIIIAVVLLKFWFEIDVLEWLTKPEVKDFFTKIFNIIVMIWENYISPIFRKVLNFINYIISRYL